MSSHEDRDRSFYCLVLPSAAALLGTALSAKADYEQACAVCPSALRADASTPPNSAGVVQTRGLAELYRLAKATSRHVHFADNDGLADSDSDLASFRSVPLFR